MLETLTNIRRDLEKTAIHFEGLSQMLSGHLVFSTYRASPVSNADIPGKIEAIDSAIEALRAAAAKIG